MPDCYRGVRGVDGRVKHYERGRGSKQAVQEELADACVALSSLCESFGREEIQKVADAKLKRLMLRLQLSKPGPSAL
jgi:NTP pyrophosphatase (non-canonical NTP hydrolase)